MAYMEEDVFIEDASDVLIEIGLSSAMIIFNDSGKVLNVRMKDSLSTGIKLEPQRGVEVAWDVYVKALTIPNTPQAIRLVVWRD